MKVRTRFAPSPTGYLHVGGIRTALFAWLLARQAKDEGEFLLRIEDTDKAREVAEADQHIIKSLQALGLNFDGEPYYQSQHLDTYTEWAQRLISTGRAYADPRTPEELDKLREDAKAKKQPFLIRHYPIDSPQEWHPGVPLRFKAKLDEGLDHDAVTMTWKDEVMGEIGYTPQALDDFILIKSDGYPTYNFAHIVDDTIMGITHVIRGQEFLPSVPNYLNLYEALKIEPPVLATMPHILNEQGNKKLSKRDDAKDVLDYIREGYLPDAMVNFIASLGWNDGTEQEIFSREELIKKFRLDHVQKSGARFDEKRLLWMNGHYIRELPADSLSALAKGFWPPEAKDASDEYKNKVVELVQERLKYFAELPELTKAFFAEPNEQDVLELYKNPVDKQLKNLSLSEIAELLKNVIRELELSNFSEEDLANRLNNLLEKLGSKPGILFAAVRVAISGAPSSPQLFGTLAVLGKEKALVRLQKALDVLAKSA